MRKMIIIFLILLPGLELAGIIYFFNLYGWWFLLYLISIAILGYQLIKEEKANALSKLTGLMSKGGNPAEAIMGSAKNFLAGILFLFPGVITDVFGLLILFKSGNGLSSQQGDKHKSSDDKAQDVIEGEFHREDKEK
ncbi:FxsA family protein [Methylophilaceae bacterium]|nr:FxsA family protein [Methylophilaceae bacterium]|tara:strand:+ start:3763 stop:4173 length:411 start_codon:yes stop_codon:yes gene_type:complete